MLAVINVILLLILLNLYRKSIIGGGCFEVLKRIKTWIIIIAIVMFVDFFIENFFEFIPNKVNLMLLFVQQVCRFVVFTLICHFFIKAAASLLSRNQVRLWYGTLNTFTFICCGVWLSFLVIYTYFVATHQNDSVYPCHRIEFIIVDIMGVLLCLSFLFFGIKINKTIKIQIMEQNRFSSMLSTPSAIHEQIVDSRRKSLRNMWIVIATLLFSTLFDLIYSIAVFFLYADQCYPQRISQTWDSLWKFIDRFVTQVVWIYPVIWVFWPS